LVSVATSWTATHGGILVIGIGIYWWVYGSWFGTGIVIVLGRWSAN
jgi:hypothetical protein